MNYSGDAAEQIVRMSLHSTEVLVRIAGDGAKNLAILLYSILKGEQQSKGKARLTNMIRSGKPLTIFTVKNTDLKKFQEEAKKYGVLYTVLKDKSNTDPNAIADVMVRTEDASKVSRIMERFNLAIIPSASIEQAREKQISAMSVKDDTDKTLDESATPPQVNKKNPKLAKTEKDPLSEPPSKKPEKTQGTHFTDKPSVRKKLKDLRELNKTPSVDLELNLPKIKAPTSKER